jgi:hypothetical protein
MNDVVVHVVKASPVKTKLKEIRLTADDGDDDEDVRGIIERSSRINTTIVQQWTRIVSISHTAQQHAGVGNAVVIL